MAFKDSNYIQIQGWMINRLKLNGNDLILFALIYGFSQDDETEFKGSQKYMCEALNRTRPTIAKSLGNLIDLGIIIKRQEVINGVTFNRYKVDLQGVKKLYIGSKETLGGGSKEALGGGSKEALGGGSKEALHNNTNRDTSSHKQGNNPPQKSLFPDSDPNKPNHFRDSVFVGENGKSLFFSKLKEEKELGVNVYYYYNVVKDWSETKTQAKFKRTNRGWISTARNIMRNDKKDNKLQMLIPENDSFDHEKDALKYLTGDYE